MFTCWCDEVVFSWSQKAKLCSCLHTSFKVKHAWWWISPLPRNFRRCFSRIPETAFIPSYSVPDLRDLNCLFHFLYQLQWTFLHKVEISCSCTGDPDHFEVENLNPLLETHSCTLFTLKLLKFPCMCEGLCVMKEGRWEEGKKEKRKARRQGVAWFSLSLSLSWCARAPDVSVYWSQGPSPIKSRDEQTFSEDSLGSLWPWP